MSKRPTGFAALPGLKVFDRLRPIVAPIGPMVLDEVRKRPRIEAGLRAIARAWTALVEAFCSMIDPYLAKCLPDLRLVALTSPSGDVEVYKVAKGVATSLGSLATVDAAKRAEVSRSKWTSIELRLGPDQLLQRTLSLPGSSREFLRPIIEHKLERLTPWRPERVLYGYQVMGDAEPGGGVNVTLTATTKDIVAEPLRVLGDAGLVPTAIGPQQGPLSEPLRINLLSGTGHGTYANSRRMVSRVALTMFVILAAAYVMSSLWVSEAADQQQADGVRLMKARRLLKSASLGAVGDRERALLDAKQPGNAVVVLIDRLATAIPNDTYLKELDITSDKVHLVGSSGNAPALIGDLEGTGLTNVRFTSALTREKDQKDSFEITADRTAPYEKKSP